MTATMTALVTGASGEIGAAIAQALGRAGYRVIVHYHTAEESAAAVVERITGSGGQAVAMKADISQREGAVSLFAEIEQQFGSVQYLVNNAGVARDAMLAFLSDEQWDTVLDTNLRGTYLCSQLALPGMM